VHFNATQKSILNWLLDPKRTLGEATYTLSPLESPGGATYAVKVPAAANRTTGSNFASRWADASCPDIPTMVRKSA
jgi:hypothetical protein